MYQQLYYFAIFTAVLGFLVFLFFTRDSLWELEHLSACFLYWAVALALLSLFEDWKETEQWDDFSVQHRCKITDTWKGDPIVGEYGKTAHLCDNGFIYWR